MKPPIELIDAELPDSGHATIFAYQLRNALATTFRVVADEVTCDAHEVKFATFGDQWIPNEIVLTSEEFVDASRLFCSARVALHLVDNRCVVLKNGAGESRRSYVVRYRVEKTEGLT